MKKTMKKIITYLGVIALGSALVASCNINDYPTFDDADAFVAFDKSSVSVAEDGGTVSIPVTLASVAGLSTSVSYEAVDGTAKAGTNFELVDGSATLKFSESGRTQYIEVKITDIPGTYTGDLSFTLKFKSTGDVNEGNSNSCKVTIVDNDHPLSFILGTYSASADSYFSSRGHFDWDITVEKDASDISMVWISNLDPYFAKYGYIAPSYNYFYGKVSDDKTTMTIPQGQSLGYSSTVTKGLNDPDADVATAYSDINVVISEDGSTLTITNAWGIYDDGWWNLFNGPIVFTKK